MTTSSHRKSACVLTAFVMLSCCLFPAAAIRSLNYMERIDALSRLNSRQHFSESQYADAAVVNRFLVTMMQTLTEQRVLEAGRTSNGMENIAETFANADAVQMNVSGLCLNHTREVIFGLLKRENWALQILDAMGKPTPGIQIGNLNWPGAYDLCLEVRATATTVSPSNVTTTVPLFSGQYVSVNMILINGNIPAGGVLFLPVISLGVCVPDTCSTEDIRVMLSDVLLQRNITFPVTVDSHQRDRSLDTKAVVAIIICSIILCLIILGTLFDILYVQIPKWRAREAPFVSANGLMDERAPLIDAPSKIALEIPKVGLCSKLLMSFSVYTNGAKLLSTRQPPGSLSCVHGIRFFSMTWVVMGHAFTFSYSVTEYFIPFYQDAVKRWTYQAILNAVVSVDTFFLLSGLLVSYLTLKEMKKFKGKINWFLFFFHRFWRLTPAYLLVIMVYVCLSPYWGHGPLWAEAQPDRDNCENYWWTNLLYINNVVHPDKMCLGQSWYLANDMQFYILSPLIVVPFFFSPLLGAISSAVFLLVTAITPGVLTMRDHFAPSSLAAVEGNTSSSSNYMIDFYIKPYNRMGPYIVGLLGGYFLYRTDCKLRINKVTNLLIWAVTTSAALAVLYGLYDACNGHPVTLPVSAFYSAVNRQVWAACVCWVIIACVTGNGGFVNTLLSWSALVPLSRLTYCIYLIHILIISLYLNNSGSLFYMSDINIVMIYLSVLVISYLAAFVVSLAFEAPMIQLERVLLHRKKQEEETSKTYRES